MVSKEKKIELIKKFGQNIKDTGLTEVQIAILTKNINNLTEHLKIHKKDIVSKRSLLKKVSQRKHFLLYLMKKKFNKYKKIIETLGIRK